MTETLPATRATEEIPEHIRALMGDVSKPAEGLEHVRRDRDIEIPRVLLMQALSPQVADGVRNIGDLVHSITGELIAAGGKKEQGYLSEPTKIVVVKHFLQWIEWKNREEGGGIIASSVDADSELAKRCEAQEKKDDGKGNQVQAVTEYHNFICLMPEYLGLDALIMVSCGKTNWKHGRNLVSRMSMRGPGIHSYLGMYHLRSGQEVNNSKQAYRVFKFENAGWATAEQVAKAKLAYDVVKDKKVEAKLDEKEGDAATGVNTENEI